MYLNLLTTIIVFALQTAINFFLTPYILRVLGDEAYGFLALANSLVNYGFILTLVINSVASRFIASSYHKGNFARASKFYSSVIVANLIFSLIVALVSFVFLVKIQSIINISQALLSDVRATMAIYFINFSIGLFNALFSVHAFIKNQMYLISIRNAISTAIYAGCVLGLFWAFEAMIYYTAIAALISSIFVFFSALFLNHKFGLNLHFNSKLFRTKFVYVLARSGLFNSLNMLSQVLISGASLLLVNIFISAFSMGILALSRSVTMIIESFVVTTAVAWNPRLVALHAGAKPLKDEVILAIKSVSFVSLPLIATFGILADEFYTLWLPFKSKEEIEFIYELVLISLVPSIIFASSRPLISINLITDKLKKPALVTLFMAVCVFCIQLIGLSFFEFGLKEIAIVITIGIALKISLFDIANAGANLGLKLSTFYPIYIKCLAVFALITGIIYPISNMLSVTNWLEFLLCCTLMSGLGYLVGFVMIFNLAQRAIFIAKIRGRF
ncbi:MULTISPECIES: MATE family efflux transporter [Campylobacter]|uniref:MATE family efflux transporter n=1 Tax=Campylobacter TaxID=194 RepID=UPI000A354399|nr:MULTISPECIES: MATE family efflux transporter [unclassified Campylobacter]